MMHRPRPRPLTTFGLVMLILAIVWIAATVLIVSRVHAETTFDRAALERVNRQVNQAIVYQRTASWTAQAGRGDCKSFAMAKRAALLAQGWSPDALHIEIVSDELGEAHAILLVDAPSGRPDDRIALDSRFVDTERWGDLVRYGYRARLELSSFAAALMAHQ